jgi:hypothetical protein
MRKKRLSHQEEFEIMKLVLDKFLWLGFVIMSFGLWRFFENDWTGGVSLVIAGGVVLALFLVIIVKEYEIVS